MTRENGTEKRMKYTDINTLEKEEHQHFGPWLLLLL